MTKKREEGSKTTTQVGDAKDITNKIISQDCKDKPRRIYKIKERLLNKETPLKKRKSKQSLYNFNEQLRKNTNDEK